MGTRLQIECQCGKFQGRIVCTPKDLNRVICGCRHCQAYLHLVNRPSALDEFGGTQVCLIPPQSLQIDETKIRCLRLTPKGPLRWHTECCQTPIANTLSNMKVPFLALLQTCLTKESQEQLEEQSPIRVRVNSPARSPLSEKWRLAHLFLRFVVRWVHWTLKGTSRDCLLFQQGAKVPISPPQQITREELKKLFALITDPFPKGR